MKRMALVVAGFLAGAIIALQVPSSAQSPGSDQPQQRTITVTGSAQLSVAPDEAVVSRNAAQGRLIDDLLGLFGGRTQPVMAHLVESGKLTLDDVQETEKLLRKLSRKEKP